MKCYCGSSTTISVIYTDGTVTRRCDRTESHIVTAVRPWKKEKPAPVAEERAA